MSERPSDSSYSFRESMLNGQTPQAFIVSRVDELRQFQDNMVKTNPQAAKGPPGKYDVAYMVQMWINQGVVTEDEVAPCVNQLGLSTEEAGVFITETLPEIREYMAEQRQKEAATAKVKQIEVSQKYCEKWGLDRLDNIASYFQSNLSKLTPFNQYWGDVITRYQSRRQALGKEVQEITDPIQRARLLMKELYHLSYIHPSEVEEIFIEEQQTDSYVYLDSLLELSKVMYQTSTGKDPDFDKVYIGVGNIGFTISHFSINDPESMKRKRRSDAVNQLVYGAKTPNEIRALWKRQIKRQEHLEHARGET